MHDPLRARPSSLSSGPEMATIGASGDRGADGHVSGCCRLSGVAEHLGAKAAADIEAHFAADRRHNRNVRRSFATGDLTLTTESDFDDDGLALGGVVLDCISAFLPCSAFPPEDDATQHQIGRDNLLIVVRCGFFSQGLGMKFSIISDVIDLDLPRSNKPQNIA